MLVENPAPAQSFHVSFYEIYFDRIEEGTHRRRESNPCSDRRFGRRAQKLHCRIANELAGFQWISSGGERWDVRDLASST